MSEWSFITSIFKNLY